MVIICSQNNHDCILIVLTYFTFLVFFIAMIILYACLPFIATKHVHNDDPQVRSKHFFIFAVTAIVLGEHSHKGNSHALTKAGSDVCTAVAPTISDGRGSGYPCG